MTAYREYTRIRETLPCGVSRGQPTDCLNWAINTALSRTSYRYAEGVAKSADTGFWFKHAWVLDSAGYVVDGVWRQPGTRYIGRVIPKWIKWDDTMKRGWYQFEQEVPLIPDGEMGLGCGSALDIRRWEILMEAGGDAEKLARLLAKARAEGVKL